MNTFLLKIVFRLNKPIMLLLCLTISLLSLSQQSNHLHPEKERLYLEFSHTQGFYSDPFYLKILNLPANTTIHYTIDGSEPTSESDTMNNATGLLVDHTCIHNPTLAYIPTNPLDTPYPWYVWKTPDNTGPEAVVLKMKLFAENIPVSDNYCLTYFFEDNLPSYFYTLPIVSIIIDSACLYDYETGIYLPGITYDYNPVWTWWGGNSGNYK